MKHIIVFRPPILKENTWRKLFLASISLDKYGPLIEHEHFARFRRKGPNRVVKCTFDPSQRKYFYSSFSSFMSHSHDEIFLLSSYALY